MTAGPHIEWLDDAPIGILRWLDGGEFGDDYSFVATVIRKGNELELKGAMGHMSRERDKVIRRYLHEQGIEWLTWQRRKNGKWVEWRRRTTRRPGPTTDSP